MGRNHNRKVRNGSVDSVQVPALSCTATGYGEQTISKNLRQGITFADVVKLVDTLVLGTSASRLVGSSPSIRTIWQK